MASVDKLWLATLTKKEEDAETDAGRLNLTINVDGEDVLDMNFGFMEGSGIFSSGLGPDQAWLGQGQAALSPSNPLPNPIESNLLTNSSIRLGIRTDDAWGPKHALLLGNIPPDPVKRTGGGVIALAMETELEHWLSTDSEEGKLTMPLRLVTLGSSSTLIRRVMLLAYTGGGSTVGTDKPIQLQITAGGNIVLQQQIPDTSQDDLEEYRELVFCRRASSIHSRRCNFEWRYQHKHTCRRSVATGGTICVRAGHRGWASK